MGAYPGMQWAAVSTHWGWMREPPHLSSHSSVRSMIHRLTCHGHFPAGASCPPTMPTSSVPGLGSGEAEEEPSGTQAHLPRAHHGPHTQSPQGHPRVGTATKSGGWPLRDQVREFGDRAGLGIGTHLRSQAWSPPSRGGSGIAATASAGREDSQSEGRHGAGTRGTGMIEGGRLSSTLTMPGLSAFCSWTP